MNNDGENGAGAPHMHYGQQQAPPKQQQDINYNTSSQPPPHQHQPQHIPGANPAPYGAHSILMNNAAAGAASRRNDEDHMRSGGMQPTPLFERLVTEEVQELKAYARIIENQNRRLAELEKVHGDLETRLQTECKARLRLEATLEQHELTWTEKYSTLEKDRDHWKEAVQLEKTKNSRLIEQVVRKEKDIQKMLQRKYDNPRGEGGHFTQSTRNFRAPNEKERSSTPNSSSRSPSLDVHKSPHELLLANGSVEAAHPTTDPDKPRSTSPESCREGFTEDHQIDDELDDPEETSPVLGSRIWENMNKSSEILIVDEASVTESQTNENRPLVVEEETDPDDDDDKALPRNSLDRLASWSSSMMLNIIPGRRPLREPPPPDWEIPKPGYKHAETQTLI